MQTQLHRRGSGNKVILIILGVVAALGLLTVAACAGCGYMGYRSFKSIAGDIAAAQASADAFLNEIQAGRTDAAYASTSASFKNGDNPEQFREFMKRFGVFKTHTSRSYTSSVINHGTAGKQAILKATLQAPDTALSCTLTLVEEDGQWKIGHVGVP